MLAVGINSTAIMAALPSMRTELGLSAAGVEWAVNAYLVVSAAFIVLGGQAADRFGARPASVAGLALFVVASCIIANAGTQAELLAGRALQGLAAAVAVPSTLAALDTSAASERRAAAIGAWTGFLMLGFSIGPLLGGALTHFTGWRVIFWFNAALMLTAMAACEGGTASRYRPVRTGGGGVLPAADRGVARQGAARRPDVLRAAQLCHGSGHRLAVDVQHPEPAALLQPLCAEPGRAWPHGAGGRRRPPAAERGAACARPVGFCGGGTPRAAPCDDGRHGADRDRQWHHRRSHRRGRDGAAGDRVCCDGRRSGRALCLGTAAGAVGACARTS